MCIIITHLFCQEILPPKFSTHDIIFDYFIQMTQLSALCTLQTITISKQKVVTMSPVKYLSLHSNKNIQLISIDSAANIKAKALWMSHLKFFRTNKPFINYFFLSNSIKSCSQWTKFKWWQLCTCIIWCNMKCEINNRWRGPCSYRKNTNIFFMS